MRLFAAVNFSDTTRARLLDIQNEMRSRAQSGRFSLPENLHLTLAFLGECGNRQAAAAKMAMNAVRFEPFTVIIAGGGYLDKGRPNLTFCELRNDNGRDKLWRLQSDLSVNLSVKGFALDKRKFWPHITLGREVVWKDEGEHSSQTVAKGAAKRSAVSTSRASGKRVNSKALISQGF